VRWGQRTLKQTDPLPCLLAFDHGCGNLARLKNPFGQPFGGGRYLLAAGAGLLLTAAFPKIGIAGFAWIAPALMIAAAQGKHGSDAFRIGYVAGLVHFLSSLYWLLLMPVGGFPVLAWLPLGAYLALYPAVWVWLINRWGERPREPRIQQHVGLPAVSPHQTWSGRLLWSLGGAAAWVALEMVRARLLGGFPWNLIGVSQFKMVPLIQIASVTGVYGISFVVVWTSLSLYSAVRVTFDRPNTRLIWQAEIILPLVAVLALFVFGFMRLSGGNPPASVLRVTLVQPSIPQTLIWNPVEDDRRFQELLAQSAQALNAESEGRVTRVLDPSIQNGTRRARPSEKTDLLLWPESAVPATDIATCRVISQFVLSNHVWLILNGEDTEYFPYATNYFNAAYLVGPDGRWLQVYHKRKLVIFGEYVPLARWLPFVKYLTPITGGWTPGDKAMQLQMQVEGREPRVEGKPNNNSLAVSLEKTIKTSPLICFEDVFPGLARDAANGDTDFLVNLTNDGWFRQSAEQWQHMANAVFRAVENGLPLVRCANNGVTCWIDASGRVQEILRDKTGGVYGIGAMTVEIPVNEQRVPTCYHRHGDWFGWSCAGIAALLLEFKINKRRKPS
jgi:apolipoprotein N-acyltransferase